MKFTKRFATMLIVFVFALSSLCTTGIVSMAADFSDVPETNPYSEAITTLVDQGIINGYGDGTFKPDNTITRAEFSKLLAIASAPTGYVFSATTTTFSDIPDMSASNGWSVPYVAYAVSTKSINGYDDGTFRAGNPVTYGEAVKMIVCTLGYGPVVDTTLSPWYQGYLDVARQIGLNKKAVALGNVPASRGIVAQLIFNMLECPQLKQTGTDATGKPIYTTQGSGSFGDSKDNAQSAEGVVMGVTDYSLNAQAVGRNRVQINNELFTLGNGLTMDTIKSLIGYRVSYSYSGTGSKRELTKLSRLSGYNSEVTIEPWQIVDLTNTYIEYYANENAEDRGETTKVNYSNSFVVYNGVPVNPAEFGVGFIFQNYFDIETGSLKLFSNDANDKTAEVIFVESYQTYYVNSPSYSDGVSTIYDKNPTYTGLTSLTLDEEDITSITKVSSKGGKPVTSSLAAITNKSVVSVAVPYGTTEGTTVIISSAYVSGEVTELDSGYKNIVIGSASYEISPYYQKLLDNGCPDAGFDLRDSAKFYLDHLGRIVYTEKNETSDPYGLVVAYATGGSIDSANSLKVMTTSGKYLEYTMKDNMRVDGASMSSDEAIAHLKTKYSGYSNQDPNIIIVPVKYRASGNQFTYLETLAPAVTRQTLKYSSSGYTFKSGSSTKFSMLTSGTNATEVFVVPSDVNLFDKYSNKAPGYFSNNTEYQVEAYELTGTNAKIVVCYLAQGQSTSARITASSSVCLVQDVTDSSNDEGQIVKKIVYKSIASATDAEPITALCADDPELAAKVANIKSGDLIKLVKENDVIADIQTVFVDGALTSQTGVVAIPGHHIYRDGNTTGDKYYQAYYGTIYNYDETSKQLSVIPAIYNGSPLDAGNIEILTMKDDNVPFYKYDTNASEFKGSAAGAIRKYMDFADSDPAKASQALVVVMQQKVVGVYLINE